MPTRIPSIRPAHRALAASLLVALCPASWGCGGWLVAFNECNPDKGQLLGRTTVELDVRRLTVRSGEAPVGNLVADALWEAGRVGCGSGGPACPVAAVENAGGIRSSTACGEREAITVGSLHEADVADMLPFVTNQVVVVQLSGEQIWLMAERAVSILGQVGEAGAGGFFLQVSGLAFEVDCARQAQTLNADGTQILQRGARVDPLRVTVAGAPLDMLATYPVAMNSFVASAGDGFLGLALRNPDDSIIAGPDGRPQTPTKTFVDVGGRRASDADAVEQYIRNKGVVAPRIEGRIRLLASCVPTG